MITSRNTFALRSTLLLTALAVILLLWTTRHQSPASSVFKMTASTGFLATALAAGAWSTNYGRSVLMALLFCWWGDYFLLGQDSTRFLLGLGSFLLGHLAFASAFLIQGVNPRWSAAVGALAVAPAVTVYNWLHLPPGPMVLPVCAYILAISLMIALAIGAGRRAGTWLIPIGALLFYASDLLVARQKFVTPSPCNPLIGLPLYYTAQLFLATSTNPAATRKAGEQFPSGEKLANSCD